MKIRIELSSLATTALSGVSNYTKLLAEAIDATPTTEAYGAYFNFLNRQVTPVVNLKQPLEKNAHIPLRIYAKLHSYGFALPFDILRPKVNLTIFPNFATWPTVHSKYRATVVHDLTYLYFPDSVERKNLAHLRRVVPRSIKQADFIITVSEAVKAEIMKEFALPSEKCIVTTIPPDATYYRQNDNEIHQKYNLPTQKFIYFMGNLEPRKNLPILIEAYCKLPDTIKQEYSLVLAGGNGWKTEQSRQVLKTAQDNGENIIHVGFVDSKDTAAFYQRASAFVMPSIYEGFGMPILEAMASGCPVIASDIPVLRETAGNAALYTDPSNSDTFSQAIQQLLADASIQQTLIERGKQQLKKFSWEKNTTAIIDKVTALSDTKQ